MIIGILVWFGLGLVSYGGTAVVGHYVLRWWLFQQGILPYPFRDGRLIAYFDGMVGRIFLRRVGGGWVFIHRTLLDFFASLYLDATPAPPVILNPAGVKNPDDAE